MPTPPTTDNSSSIIGECVKCPTDGTNCDKEGITLEELPLKSGYWRSGTQSFLIEQCYTADACSQANSSQCSEGHHGVLCNVCLPDYTMGVLGICEVCVTENKIPIQMLVFFAIVIGGILLLVFIAASIRRYKESKRQARKITVDRISQFRQRARTASTVDDSDTLFEIQHDKSH